MSDDAPKTVGRPPLPPEVKQSNKLTVYLDRSMLSRLLKYKAHCTKEGDPVSDSRIALRGLDKLFRQFEAKTGAKRSGARTRG